MREITIKLSRKEAQVFTGLLVDTENFIQMQKDESNNEKKRLDLEKYIQTVFSVRSRIEKQMKK